MILEKYNKKVKTPYTFILWTAYYNDDYRIHYSEKNRSE